MPRKALVTFDFPSAPTVGGATTWYVTPTGTNASGTWGISVTGNAGTVTNGVYTTGDQTIAGIKTFSSSVDAPAFRDSANTAYYLDPASTGTALTVAGDVGIGTTSPNLAKLDVRGRTKLFGIDDAYQLRLAYNFATSGAWIGSPSANALAFYNDAGTERMRIDSAGNLGIGTTSPAHKLTVNGTIYSERNGTNAILNAFLANNKYIDFQWYGSSIGGIGQDGASVQYSANLTHQFIVNGTNRATLASTGFSINTDVLAPIYYDSANTAYYLDPANTGTSLLVAGNVGIGTTSPWEKLSVPFNTGIALGSSTYSYKISRSSSGELVTTFSDTYDASTARVDFVMRNGAPAQNTALSILGTGNVGIGTTSPLAKLDVNGNIRTSAGSGGTITAFDNNSSRNNRAILGADANGAYLDSTYSSAGTGTITFRTIGTERVRISEAGNVGIGVTPSAWSATDSVRALQLNGGSFYVYGANRCFLGQNVFLASGGIETYATTAAASTYRQYQGAHSWYTAPSGTAGNAITFTQAMTLDASGNLGIGTTSPTQKLDVRGRTGLYGISDAYQLKLSYALGTAGAWIGSPSANALAFYNDAGTQRMIIDSNGTMTLGGAIQANLFYDNTNTAYYLNPSDTGTSLNVAGSIVAAGNVTAYSDIRVKDNVEDITDAVDKLSQIRGVTYTRTDLDDKERKYAGVIAQEIEQVLPEAVFDNGKVKAVDYNATIALLIEAVKEQQGQINELKLTIEQLKGN
jgi:hypothetical protein